MTTEFPDADGGILSDAVVPDGWSLHSRNGRPDGVMVRYGRSVDGASGRHWITASGATYDEALTAACHRMRLFDEIG